MRLPDRLGRRLGRPFHSAIATSFAVEFAAVEQILLPQLMASGASNLLLITDARMASLALSDGSILPTALGRDYALHSPPAADGIFHPKIILQIGRNSARAFVSSANLTAAGLAGNAEVSIEIECNDEDGPEREIVRSIWRYLDALVPSSPSPARDGLRWAGERAAWLDGPPGLLLQELDDGSAIAFVSAPDATGIGDRFVSFVGDEKVQSLVVISPYWDTDLSALADLSRRLAPKQIILPIDATSHEFPVDAPFASKPRIVELGWSSRRFTHAKIIVASTARHDHVLFGSANCTTPALGRAGATGSNAEACIYRRLRRGGAREALGLDRWLDGDAIALGDLPPRVPSTPIPLKAIEARQPGTFELDGAVLSWRPLVGGVDEGHVQLLDNAANMLVSIPVASFQRSGDTRTASVDPEVQRTLCFARLVSGDFSSTIAHVAHRNALRTRRREMPTGAVARALAPFTDGADFDLWMHQAFETLARADFEQTTQPPSLASARKTPRKRDGEPHAPVSLSYEEFVQTHPRGRRAGAGDTNSLAGTYSDSIRDFLNLLSGRAAAATATEDDDPTFDDPTEEAGDRDPDDGANGGVFERPRQPDEEPVDPAPIDARLYERHVTAYAEGLEWEEEPLGPSDVLRLRFWILFLLYKARCPDLPHGLDDSSATLSWPRFTVRILVAFFCGRMPAITRLMMARDYSGMPVDFMECWITVLWSLDAIERLLADRPKERQFLKYIPELRRRVVALLGLSPDELAGSLAGEVREGLDRSVGRRLALVR
ncbi:hypothetical protein PX554_18940 [Sphingomonas sp. H39-1-10]|uniref:hypothetical protein n=1 Tax=Sphingomonas pollutisoli TaxID=3030829 RepID=UPI0023B8F3F9|nr:hypothetical protein [Sphingomonas pollutisoli]MDF0490208.1 hypothetical protein [Sphingomonas pollutisoli]